MAGKTTVPCTDEQYRTIITTIFEGVGTAIQPNPRIATALQVEASTGLRIGDIVSLRLCDIIYDGCKHRFNIEEQKTGKKRTFTVPNEVYDLLKEYCRLVGIAANELIFPITVRAVQKHLAKVIEYLGAGYENISTHSFRKKFAKNAYELSGHDIELVKQLLQHSSTQVTSRYLGVTDERIEDVLKSCVSLIGRKEKGNGKEKRN